MDCFVVYFLSCFFLDLTIYLLEYLYTKKRRYCSACIYNSQFIIYNYFGALIALSALLRHTDRGSAIWIEPSLLVPRRAISIHSFRPYLSDYVLAPITGRKID